MSTDHLFLFDSAFCVHLTWALLHFVWQGALIVGGSILAVWLLGRDSPRRRHRVYLTAMLLMLLCVPVTLAVVATCGSDRGLPAAGADALASWPTQIGPEVASPDEVRRSSEVVARPEPLASSNEVAVAPRGITGEAWARWTALGYVLGVALMLSRVLLAVQGGRRLRRVTSPVREPDLLAAIRTQVERFGLRIAPSVSWCDRVLVPVVIGLGKPAILLPTSLVTGLTPAQLSLVIR